MHHDCPEEQSIAGLHALVQVERHNTTNGGLDSAESKTSRRGIKRERDGTRKEVRSNMNGGRGRQQAQAFLGIKLEPTQDEHVKIKVEPSIDGVPDLRGKPIGHHGTATDVEIKDEGSDASSPSVQFILEPKAPAEFTPQPDISVKDEQPDVFKHRETEPDWNYYLLKPSTASASQVLIPMKYSNSLTDSLHDRDVQEYPTIFALSNPPEALPAGFVLEKDYKRASQMKSTKDQNQPSFAFDADRDSKRKVEADHRDGESEALTAKTILDTLRRDLTR